MRPLTSLTYPPYGAWCCVCRDQRQRITRREGPGADRGPAQAGDHVTPGGPRVRTAEESQQRRHWLGESVRRNRVRLSGGSTWQTGLRRRTTGRPARARTPMEIAHLPRSLSHTLLDLQRAVERCAVADAADLYALAWGQVARTPPSETRKQREELQARCRGFTGTTRVSSCGWNARTESRFSQRSSRSATGRCTPVSRSSRNGSDCLAPSRRPSNRYMGLRGLESSPVLAAPAPAAPCLTGQGHSRPGARWRPWPAARPSPRRGDGEVDRQQSARPGNQGGSGTKSGRTSSRGSTGHASRAFLTMTD